MTAPTLAESVNIHVIESPDGHKAWYRSGRLHRDEGPAIEWPDGSKQWYRDGKLHRDDGPAVEYSTGLKMWFKHGAHHREDGPAIERPDGGKQWYRNGLALTAAEITVIQALQAAKKAPVSRPISFNFKL